jgi:hypothetical protein
MEVHSEKVGSGMGYLLSQEGVKSGRKQ